MTKVSCTPPAELLDVAPAGALSPEAFAAAAEAFAATGASKPLALAGDDVKVRLVFAEHKAAIDLDTDGGFERLDPTFPIFRKRA